MTPLRQRFIEDMQLRGLALTTHAATAEALARRHLRQHRRGDAVDIHIIPESLFT